MYPSHPLTQFNSTFQHLRSKNKNSAWELSSAIATVLLHEPPLYGVVINPGAVRRCRLARRGASAGDVAGGLQQAPTLFLFSLPPPLISSSASIASDIRHRATWMLTRLSLPSEMGKFSMRPGEACIANFPPSYLVIPSALLSFSDLVTQLYRVHAIRKCSLPLYYPTGPAAVPPAPGPTPLRALTPRFVREQSDKVSNPPRDFATGFISRLPENTESYSNLFFFFLYYNLT